MQSVEGSGKGSQVLIVSMLKSHKSDRDRLVILEGDGMHSLDLTCFTRCDSSLL